MCRSVRVLRRLVGRGAPDLDLRQRGALEPFDQHPVAAVELGDQLVHGRVGAGLELADLREAPIGSDHDLERAGMPVPPRILAFVVDVERVMRVLDDRDALTVPLQVRDQLLDQRGLARARETAETDHVHRGCVDHRMQREDARRQCMRRAAPIIDATPGTLATRFQRTRASGCGRPTPGCAACSRCPNSRWSRNRARARSRCTRPWSNRLRARLRRLSSMPSGTTTRAPTTRCSSRSAMPCSPPARSRRTTSR